MPKIYDAAIIGGGPAGIACALRCKELGVKAILLEAGILLNTIRNYPKGKLLFGVPGFYKADPKEFIALLERDVRRANILVKTCEPVRDIRKERGTFYAVTPRGKYAAKTVVLAFGVQGAPNRLGVPGEDLPFVHYTLHDPEKFRSKKVLVVGGGDSALEAATLLAEAGAQVILSYRRDSFFRAKEENVHAFNTSKAKPLFGTRVVSIEAGRVQICTAEGKKESLYVDDVFVLIGSKANTGLIERAGVEIDGSGMPVVDKNTFESNVEGVYVIGDLVGTGTILPAFYAGFKIAPAILLRAKRWAEHD